MLDLLVEKKKLDFDSAYNLFTEMFNESEIRISAYLSALQTKGYSGEELAGFAKAMRDKAIRVDFGEVCDTCGTGGDGSNTINVSTTSAIILSCYKRVAKHGNTSITSKSGSADLLKALGINYWLSPEEAKECIEKTNFTFLFAPLYHPALKRVMPVRKELGIRTVFNVLGPLANPANPEHQLIGVSSEHLVDVVAEALMFLGVEAVVVHGNGIDEANPRKESVIAVVSEDIEKFRIKPEDFGLTPVKIIPCSGAEESADRIFRVLSGKGFREDRNFIVINSALALFSTGIDDFHECRELAESVLGETAIKKLEGIRCFSTKSSM
ncbi:anthranilate phosphoribosyltransferase [Archaeoglobus sulfaticallidus PM70-1]|uniref:Anthranilate phosphoribosyltransferase n=1 Tax=Archaeoglobus sulfaticallidus PM70-1 TaxID=387631 RepID=N0BAM2_9EURY|nr:anthranilate phosphoribosyltransferase [Archaeoglobus sulfaticallidus]AGK60664.1 anthranilate phosphoribosyltransferase [Archaeoglobus sulfaticallidus PM70-1]